MTLKISFILTKRHLRSTEGIESLALSEIKRTKLVEKGAFASAVLAKHNGEEVLLKEMFCEH